MPTHPSLPARPFLLAAPGEPYLHRDLSWLQFNDRVLAEALDRSNPLLERLKFLAISSSNLDEFFMIRFSSLNRSIQTVSRTDRAQCLHLQRIRARILNSVAQFQKKQAHALKTLLPELAKAGIHLHRNLAARHGSALETAKRIFETKILPLLGEPEPFSPSHLSQLQNLQLAFIHGSKGHRKWLKIPKSLPWVYCERIEKAKPGIHAFFLDDLLKTFLGAAFEVKDSPILLRVTRDGDLSIDLGAEDDPESLPDIIRKGLRARERGKPVRLQHLGEIPAPFRQSAVNALRIQNPQAFSAPVSMGLHGLWALVSVAQPSPENPAPGLVYPHFKSLLPKPFENPATLFAKLDREDILLHHPYDSFDAYVKLIEHACADPKVIEIDQTVYRIETLSPVVDALKAAAKKKKVRVVIELRARFDELNNLKLSEELKAAGVEVAFGFGKLKLHAKVALITRISTTAKGGFKRYTHLSTGNYNSNTARLYTDLSVLTGHPEIGNDAKRFFDSVFKGELPTEFTQLVSAPTKLHRLMISHIQHETQAALAGQPARIVAKVNALVDRDIVDALYKASRAGVRIELIVRGACSLIPGVKGLSENIKVIGVVDRFLEHSRMYYFGNAKALYLSSADWMPRNFFSRVEFAFPVLDPHVLRFLEDVLIPVYLSEEAKAHELGPQGIWKKVPSPKSGNPTRAQFVFEQIAAREYKGTPLE